MGMRILDWAKREDVIERNRNSDIQILFIVLSTGKFEF